MLAAGPRSGARCERVRGADGRAGAGARVAAAQREHARLRGASAPIRSACRSSTGSSRTARCGSSPTRSRCCRRSASSTRAPPAWWRCRAPTDASLHVAGLGGELKPFQRAGVSYLLARRRAFLADEQGLGKTIEALAALEAGGAYPAVVVCPASLKLNWLRELERWLPQRRRRVRQRARGNSGAGGRRRAPRTSRSSTTTSSRRAWRSCARWSRARSCSTSPTTARTPRPSARRRSSGCRRRCRATGLVLALSGTPVTNRPAELISQLRILGRLEDFGSGARFGERFRGADAHLRLHWHLRARCFVRRLKADVLPQLPAKTRAIVPVELDNEAEYRLAERDLVAWLRSQPLDLRELDAKVAAALRAERLVRCNALKLLAARGKLHAALAWIHDFCSSGERLVVFAGHREIQRAVLERFPAALHILGEDSAAARDAALRAFQAPRAERGQPADRLLDRGRRPRPDADALLERRVPRARLDARQARPGRGPLPPHRPAGRGQRLLPAGGGHDRRDDLDAARAQARGDRRASPTAARRTRRACSTRSCASCAAAPYRHLRAVA